MLFKAPWQKNLDGFVSKITKNIPNEQQDKSGILQ